ncbi:MAG: hypothetical protein VW540_02850 [Gammaproteobacteria bacterium]
MSALSLKFKINSKHRLDMSWLSNIKSDDVTKLKNTKINYGNKLCKVSELFIVSGNDHNEIKITNSNNRLDNIGHNLKNKKILIEGNVGFGLAKNMDSGEIILKGNAGDNACSGMRGGSVSVYGSVGNGLCSMPTSQNQGLVDGFIYVQKNVGSSSIIRMRRGNVIIGGSIGDDSCLEMISGSITILGRIGKNFCKKARRATIITRDRSICKNYIKANKTDLTFFNFYRLNINKILNKNIIASKNPQRYFGTKSKKELIELFVV